MLPFIFIFFQAEKEKNEVTLLLKIGSWANVYQISK